MDREYISAALINNFIFIRRICFFTIKKEFPCHVFVYSGVE